MTLCPFLEVLPLFLLLWYKALRGSFSAYINEAADIFGITEKTTEYGVAFALKYLSSEMLTYFFGYGGDFGRWIYTPCRLFAICTIFPFAAQTGRKLKTFPVSLSDVRSAVVCFLYFHLICIKFSKFTNFCLTFYLHTITNFVDMV